MEGQASSSSSSSGGALPDAGTGTVSMRQGSESAPSTDDTVHVTVVHDELTFENRQALRLKEIERKLIEDTKRKKREWERDVEKMRDEFLLLYPCDNGGQTQSASDEDGGGEPGQQEGLVAKRRGSTDVLDSKKMKTLFLEYPDAGRRYKIRFNVAGFDPDKLRVATDGDRIIVRGTRRETPPPPSSGAGSEIDIEREYERKIEKPREVDAAKLKSYLTTDGILIIEAPVPPKSLNLRKTNQSSGSPQRGATTAAAVANSHHGSMASVRSASPATAANHQGTTGTGTAATSSSAVASTGSMSALPVAMTTSAGPPQGSPCREKIGFPMFYDDGGRRKMLLIVDVGTSFGPKEITALIIKDNRIQIKARHEERTLEKLCKNKYTKEFELAERIETYSLRGGLTPEGRLYVGAIGKGHAVGLTKVGAGELVEDDIAARTPENTQACNMLDLSSFPPTTPQLIASSSSYSSG